MTKPDGLDESYGYADPATAAAAGIKVVMMYLSHTPAKNATPAKIVGYHTHGIGVLLGWESSASRALEGATAGAADGADAAALYDSLVHAVGYAPRNKPAIPFAVDFDTNSGEYGALDAYLTAAKHALAGRYLTGVYGEADLLDHTSGAHVSEMEFGTYAWSGGRVSGSDDFHQYLNGQQFAGAEVDFDRVVHPTQVGAWWPPNSPFNTDASGGNVSANGPEHWDAADKKVIAALLANQLTDMLHYLGGSGNNGGDSGAFTAKELEPLGGVLYRLAVNVAPHSGPKP